MVGAALVQPHLHSVQLVLHRGAVLLLLLLLLPRRPMLLLLLLLLLRRGRGRSVVEAGSGDRTQAELRQIAHPLGVRHGERLSVMSRKHP
tara:strand:- start:308 stop:577 length:270 start_codon:yes stop_codon:yes gene_type:complete